jgi:FtsP/CotA-like multicopper oxidase with cupredoxin domain
MELSRRDLVKLGLVGGAALLVPIDGVARTALKRPLRDLPKPFQADLPIPSRLRPMRSTATTDFYRMTLQEGTADILPGLTTPIFGYNGMFPGPTVVTSRERRVVIEHVNQLPVPTSMHTHGAFVDGDSDGHPLDLVMPGSSKTYILHNDETARTQWYHDHAMHITAENVYHGLAGMYLIDDDFERELPLPRGTRDVPLVLQDRFFNEDGSFDYPVEKGDSSSNGVLGNVIMVNGKPWPRLEVQQGRYRFRVLNGANARVFELALSNRQPFALVGTEGGLIHRPLHLQALPMAPGERMEIVVNFADVPAGSSVMLMNRRAAKQQAQIMRFDVVPGVARDDSRVPDVIRPADLQDDPTHRPARVEEAVKTRQFVFKRSGGFWTINGKIFDEHRLDARPKEGATEIWEFVNNGGGWIHPIHLHFVNFKVLSRNGGMPRPWEQDIWKETVFLDGGDSVRVLAHFPKVPREVTTGAFVDTYAFHCHLLEHEDHDMMLQFRVEPAV